MRRNFGIGLTGEQIQTIEEIYIMKNRLKNVLKSNKGFTLIELLVVIVVVLILASIAIPSFTKLVGEANYTKTVSEGRVVYMLALYDCEQMKMTGTMSNNQIASALTNSTYLAGLKDEAGLASTASVQVKYSVPSGTGSYDTSAGEVEVVYGGYTFPDVLETIGDNEYETEEAE